MMRKRLIAPSSPAKKKGKAGKGGKVGYAKDFVSHTLHIKNI